jgi:hypothetical protein
VVQNVATDPFWITVLDRSACVFCDRACSTNTQREDPVPVVDDRFLMDYESDDVVAHGH